jgi:hypothetical protein
MRYAAALGIVPMLSTMLTVWPAKPPPVADRPMVVKAVYVEPIREQRMDNDTFRLRWSSATGDLPPAMVQSAEIRIASAVPLQADQGKPAVETGAAPPPARHVKRAALLHRDNVCVRHGKRKVTYLKRGYKFWKCR